LNYDEFYRENEAYFGNPFPELIDYFQNRTNREKILDVGCGQGRNAIPLSQMGYHVYGIDTSRVAIEQLKRKLPAESQLHFEWKNFFALDTLHDFDVILLDGFFHFNKHDRHSEAACIKKIQTEAKRGALVVCCFAEKGKSVATFEELIEAFEILHDESIEYTYVDPISKWEFQTLYRLFVLKVN
jgi:2-polyprenyl-3-methyl-5-hydroxy-6-metoxy-1,4-benzoquinol methylase